jgi:DNA-binding MarR family transcriptional regulator
MPEPNLLNDNAIREVIRTFGLVERVMQPYFAQFGISGSQWGVLRNLHRAEREGLPSLRLSELSDRLLIRPPSVTGLIDRLERAGLVVRFVGVTDLRVRQIKLTRAGRQLVERVLTLHEAQLQKVLGGLSAAEQSELSRLLVTWSRHLQGLLSEGTLPAPAGIPHPAENATVVPDAAAGLPVDPQVG